MIIKQSRLDKLACQRGGADCSASVLQTAKQSAWHHLVRGGSHWSKSEEAEERKVEKYLNPEIEVVELEANDVITTSPGTETPWYEESDGIWEFSLNP